VNVNDNKDAGNSFEKLFEKQCQLHGLWADKNHLKAQRMWKGKLRALPSNLDFTVIDPRTGRVGFIDCKSFERSYLTYSELPDHQVTLAARYNEMQVPAGFVVFFRETDQVFFYSGGMVACSQGTRSTLWHGTYLGKWPDFDPRIALDPKHIFPLAIGFPPWHPLLNVWV
jgi:hypothetical protein